MGNVVLHGISGEMECCCCGSQSRRLACAKPFRLLANDGPPLHSIPCHSSTHRALGLPFSPWCNRSSSQQQILFSKPKPTNTHSTSSTLRSSPHPTNLLPHPLKLRLPGAQQVPYLTHLLNPSVPLEFFPSIACHLVVCGGGEFGAGAEDEAVEG